MFTLKIFVIILLASVAFCLGAEEETISVETNVLESNPAETAMLTQLVVQESASPYASYNHKCTFGTYASNRVVCTAADNEAWSTARNVEKKLRCPNSGVGVKLSYVEINFTVSTPNVFCYVNEGATAWGYIGITVQAWNTLIFNYSAKFYTY